MAVKPEMSMKASVPATSRHNASGSSRSHSSVSLGTNGTSSAADGADVIASVIRDILRERRRRAKQSPEANLPSRNVYASSTQSPQKGDVRYVEMDE